MLGTFSPFSYNRQVAVVGKPRVSFGHQNSVLDEVTTLAADDRVDVCLLANYALDRQQSMLGYADLLQLTLNDIPRLDVRRLEPPALLGRLADAAGFRSRLLFNVDKLVGGRRVVARHTAPVLHIADHSYAWYAAYSPARLKLITCHDLIPFLAEAGELEGWQPSRMFRQRMKQIARGITDADHVICVSDATRRDLERLLGVTEERATVIHLCLRDHLPNLTEAQALAQWRACGLNDDNQLVLVLGGAFYKNRPAAIRAFGAAVSRLSSDVVLCLVSSPTEALESELRRLDLSGRVRFLPAISNERLSALFRRASVLLMPSLYEGFGWPVIEAQSLRVPVICSTASALLEIAGGAALTAEAHDHERIAEHLVALLQDKDLAAALRVRGWENVKRFGIADWKRRHALLYNGVLRRVGLI